MSIKKNLSVILALIIYFCFTKNTIDCKLLDNYKNKVLNKSLEFSFACQGEDDKTMELPDGYKSTNFYRDTIYKLSGIVRSTNETIYIEHLNNNDQPRISTVDITTGDLTTVVDFDQELDGPIYGGPVNTFFITINQEIRQYQSNGNYTVWAVIDDHISQGFYYGPSGTMYTTDQGSVYTITPDGTETLFVTGLGGDLDMVEDSQGTVFIADTGGGKIYKIDASGKKTELATILADMCKLSLDNDDNLYGNHLEAGYDFAQIDKETGDFTLPIDQNEVPGWGDFIFLDDGRIVFCTNNLDYYDPVSQEGCVIFDDYVFSCQQLGFDGKLYAKGENGTSKDRKTHVITINQDGSIEVLVDDLEINSFVLDDSGGLFIDQIGESSRGLYYYSDFSSTGQLISGDRYTEYSTLAYNPKDAHLYAQTNSENPGEEIAIHEYSKTGFVASHTVTSPEKYNTLRIAIDPGTGTIYAVADEAENYDIGPDVKRWIFKLDLDGGTAEIFAQNDLIGHCCPYHYITIDANGDIWWVLDPDFWIYRVNREGDSEPFACHIIMDAAVLLSNGQGVFYLFHPGGIDKIIKQNNSTDNQAEEVILSQKTYEYGDQLVVTLPSNPDDEIQYVAIQMPDSSLYFLSDLHTVAPDFTEWIGEDTVLDLPLLDYPFGSVLDPGTYTIYLLRISNDVEDPLSSVDMWRLGMSSFTIME